MQHKRVWAEMTRILEGEPVSGREWLFCSLAWECQQRDPQRKKTLICFLQHVLPSGFQKVRHYGFAHPRQQVDHEWLKMLVTVTLQLVYVLTVAAQPLPVPHRPTCPTCGGELTYVGFLPAPKRRVVPHDTS